MYQNSCSGEEAEGEERGAGLHLSVAMICLAPSAVQPVMPGTQGRV